MELGVAYTAMTTDIATEVSLGKSYGNLDEKSFNIEMIKLNHRAGAMWHGTKHVPYYKAMMGFMMMLTKWLGQTPHGLKVFIDFNTVSPRRSADLVLIAH